MRKLVYISISLLVFTLMFSSMSYAYIEDYPTQDPQELVEFADMLLTEEGKERYEEEFNDNMGAIGPEGYAFFHYSMAYHLTEDNALKEDIDNKASELRQSEEAQRAITADNLSFGFNFEDDILAEAQLMSEARKAEFNLDDFMVYELTLINRSDTEININLFMTDITAISDHSQQYTPIDYSGLMGLDIPFDKIGELQENLQGDQTIYPGAEDSIFLIFRDHFTPDRIIVDGIIGEGFLDDKRIDIEFIGM